MSDVRKWVHQMEEEDREARARKDLVDKIYDAGGMVLRTPLLNDDGTLNEKTCDDLLDLLGQGNEKTK
jgi:hypothetical protein